jgi:hypothetical protein
MFYETPHRLIYSQRGDSKKIEESYPHEDGEQTGNASKNLMTAWEEDY